MRRRGEELPTAPDEVPIDQLEQQKIVQQLLTDNERNQKFFMVHLMFPAFSLPNQQSIFMGFALAAAFGKAYTAWLAVGTTLQAAEFASALGFATTACYLWPSFLPPTTVNARTGQSLLYRRARPPPRFLLPLSILFGIITVLMAGSWPISTHDAALMLWYGGGNLLLAFSALYVRIGWENIDDILDLSNFMYQYYSI